MLTISRPSTNRLDRFLADRESLATFDCGGVLPGPTPEGFARNHYRGCLGRGVIDWNLAQSALRHWCHFPGGWIDVHPQPAIEVGATVAVVAKALGIWSVNACRIVDVREESQSGWDRFAFTYATLNDHMMQGAERFCVEWNRSTDEVWYDLSSIARPKHPLARLIWPYVRRLQRRFAGESYAALKEAISTNRDRTAESTPVEVTHG